MKNLLIVISGPSGVGKGTIVKSLVEKGFKLSVSCTTRGMRQGEIDGESYFFIDRPKFESLIQNDGLLEYDEHFGNYYGTPKAFVEESLRLNDVILEIEVNGALKVKSAYPDALMIMIAPPSEQELIYRIVKRQNDATFDMQDRLKRAKYELSFSNRYDYVVVNDDLETAICEIEQIIKREKERKI